jgi:hypothetical protein
MLAAGLASTGLVTPGSSALADGAASSSPEGTPQSPARAGAVTLGQIASTTPANCTPGPTTMAQYLEGGAPSYVTPSAGVITGYSVRAGTAAGLVRLVVFGPSATPGHRTVVALSAQNPVVVSTVNTFPTRIPVAAGLSIGLNNSANGMTCWGAGVAGDQVAAATFDPGASTDFPGSSTFPNVRVNISAVLEPDVDGDQYGDVSQDLCPQSKLTQAACPAPDTTVTKQPKKSSSKRKAKIKFTSAPGSTFTCAVDGKAAKPCTSPFKKRFKYGKHVVLITAISQFGIVETTPAQVKFKIKRPV